MKMTDKVSDALYNSMVVDIKHKTEGTTLSVDKQAEITVREFASDLNLTEEEIDTLVFQVTITVVNLNRFKLL